MAIAMLIEVPGLTQEQYEAAVQHMSQAGPATGVPLALVHVAGPVDGGYRIVEVWNSQEDANAFYGSALFQETTANLPQPTMNTWPLTAVAGSGLKEAS